MKRTYKLDKKTWKKKTWRPNKFTPEVVAKLEERKMRKQKTYSDREEILNEMWLESYDVRRDEHYEDYED